MRVGFAFAALALATLILALTTNPRSSGDLIERLVSPAVSDRRAYTILRQDVSPNGVARIDGAIDGAGVIKGMRWYVNGAAAAIESLELHGNTFSVKIGLPPDREQWTVFAIASIGRFAHFVPMRTPLFLSLPGPVARAEPTSYPVAASKRAAASLDYAATGSEGASTSIALAGKPLLQWFSGAHIVLTGWAVDLAKARAAHAVLVGFDRSLFRATLGGRRPDVARFWKSASYVRSGFSVTIPSIYVTPGTHHVTVYVLNGLNQLQLTGCDLTVAVSTM